MHKHFHIVGWVFMGSRTPFDVTGSRHLQEHPHAQIKSQYTHTVYARDFANYLVFIWRNEVTRTDN